MKRNKNSVYIILGAMLWGCIGLFTRTLYSAGLSAFNIIAIRNSGSLLVMAAVFALYDRSVFKVKLKHLPVFFLTGVVSIMLFTLCYFSCQRLCSLAVSGILLYTAPAFVVIMSALLWREKVGVKKLAALLLSFAGCVFVSGVGSGERLSAAGLLLGLGSGFFYATYSIFSRYGLKHYSPYTVTFWTFVFAGIGSLCFVDSTVVSALSEPWLLLNSAGLVVISTVLPYLLYTRGLAGIESGRASIMASVEPVVAAVVGALAFRETMGVSALIGMLCVLSGVVLLAGEK